MLAESLRDLVVRYESLALDSSARYQSLALDSEVVRVNQVRSAFDAGVESVTSQSSGRAAAEASQALQSAPNGPTAASAPPREGLGAPVTAAAPAAQPVVTVLPWVTADSHLALAAPAASLSTAVPHYAIHSIGPRESAHAPLRVASEPTPSIPLMFAGVATQVQHS